MAADTLPTPITFHEKLHPRHYTHHGMESPQVCHKGEIISLATKAKKTQQERIKSLNKKIIRLEISHKQSSSHDTLQDLMHMRATLLDGLVKRYRRRYILDKKCSTDTATKGGRLLARTIQAVKSSTMIHHISFKQGMLFSKNGDIAKQLKRSIQNFITY